MDFNFLNENHNAALNWLEETYSEHDYKILVNRIKFRKVSTAVAFKLMY